MAIYTVDANNQATEDALLAYKEAQFLTRGQVGVIFRACNEALSKNANMAARLGPDGDLATMAEYHIAKAAVLGGGEMVLIKAIGDLAALIQGMQSAMPAGNDLFPGVPRI